MSNNDPNNSGIGPVSIPYPTITSVPVQPTGGWYIFQTTYPSQTITIGGTDPSVGELRPPVEDIKINKNGCRCKKCKEYYPFAQANQEDGTLICYVCRKGL